MDELKPCPFCGEIPSYVTKEGFLPIYPANKTAWCSCKFNGCPNAERTYSVIEWEERPGEAAAEQRGLDVGYKKALWDVYYKIYGNNSVVGWVTALDVIETFPELRTEKVGVKNV